MINIKYFLVVQLLFSFCLCEITIEQKEKFLNGFLQYYNGLPNQVYHGQEGSVVNTQQVDDTTYQIIAEVRVAEIQNVDATKLLNCTATLKDSEVGVTVINGQCEDAVEQKQSPDDNPKTTLEAQVEVSEPTIERKPIQLDNEVQADTAITSGEQFIAIPRDQPSAPCVGCASHVNPQAAGVSDLANLGVRHLNLHEPAVKHSLHSVIDVERQVQVVNGVRYILTLSINSNNCTQVETENCASSKTCKITILVKPWVKLSNGGNYRAILANNCTEEWLFGEHGEVLPEPSPDNNQSKGNTSVDSGDDDIQIKHNSDVQSQQNQARPPLTDEDIKKIQEQIISFDQFQAVTESDRQSFTISPDTRFTTTPDTSDVSKQHVFKIESENHNENSVPVTESEKTEHQSLNINLDKKKAIDDMLDFFDFSGFKPKTEDVAPRVKRSYDYDLQLLSLAEDYRGIKNSIENARFMYEMAQAMVDYLNEMDMEVKNRAVKNVIRAEEETENMQRFVYIQARVTIPCDKVECESRDVDTQICNGVVDCSNEKIPRILNTFCYNDNKDSDFREDIKEISTDDLVLRKMAEEAVKQIEFETKSQYALGINKIASAIMQVTSGTLTKFSVIVENLKCNKSVPLPLRVNCTVLEQLGTKICDVIVHERHWLKEKKVSYTCTDRPADMRISKTLKVNKNVTTEEPEIIEMLQEAIQYLESQSDKSNRLKIVSIQSISSQIIAGFLTKIEFVVGYTDCTDENYSRDQINKCGLLKGEGLRSCKAQIWDRSWIMDGRQIEVSCDDVSINNELVNTRNKRSIDSTSDQEELNFIKNSDLDYKKIANESLYKFMQSSNSYQHYELVKVDKVTVQDVSRKLIKIDFSISPTDCLIQNDGILSSSECKIENPKNILHCRSKILESNWIDKKQYFVKCKIKYQPQKNYNELKERNPKDSKYYQLAEESLTTYLQETGNPHHVIVRVENVTTQIVSGLLTKIDFIVSPKSQSASDSKTVRCHSEILEKHWIKTKTFNVSCQMKQKVKNNNKINIDDPKYMQIAVESLQKYIKNKPESNLVRVAFVDKVIQKGKKNIIRFIASHAEEGDGDTVCFAEMSESTESRSDIHIKCHLIGNIFRKAEIIEDDPNYYKYVKLADDCLHNYLKKMNNLPYSLLNIVSVTVQWDDGIKTIINFNISPDSENSELAQSKHCIAELLEQPWLQKNKIIQDVKCELEKDLYRSKRKVSDERARRQLGGINEQMAGGAQDQDPTDPKYRALAEESLRKYAVDSGITQPLAVARVVKVSTQTVSGTMTRLDFIVTGSSDSTTIECHSEVWEQPWLNKKEMTVSCEENSHRSKREVPLAPLGGEVHQNPTEPQYRALAEESLRKYVVDSGITQPLALARVVKVSTQTVSGTMTRLDFIVTGSSDSTTIECHSEVWEQPWLKKKEITVSCKTGDHRSKREVPLALVGGEEHQNPTEPKYRALAQESLRKYAVDSGITQPLAVVRVDRVTTQVVSGSLTRLDFVVTGSSDTNQIECHSEVWEQPWLNKKEITVSCKTGDHRSKREVPLAPLGGEVHQNPTEPQYRALAEESLRKYTVDSGITQPLAVARVVKVSTQTVSGTMTRLDFIVTGSSDSTTIDCHSEVWEQPWLKKKEITVSCKTGDHRSKREVPLALVGGEEHQNPTEPKYRALAEESLRKYAVDSGITQPLAVVRVDRVTTQVVSGSLTRLDFVVTGSSDTTTIECHSEVWEQPWLNKKEITVSCKTGDHRSKREVPLAPLGGEEHQNPTEPQYRALAEESLRKYTVDSGITQPLVVVRVDRVTTQVLSGSLTRLYFIVTGSSDSTTFKCNSKVWEQPWLNKKEITVSCEENSHSSTREVPLAPLGGEVHQNPTEPQYRALAEESLRKYTVDSGITQPLAVARVVKVSTQTVSGTMTRLDFIVTGSSDSTTIDCHSEVWEQPWLKKKEITVSCKTGDHRSKREVPLALVGGEEHQNPTEPKYRALAEESLRKYAVDSGITQPLAVVRVDRVTTQVVSGSLTRLDFVVTGSSDTITIECHSEVWEQPWLNKKEITVSCKTGDHRSKREVPLAPLGGEEHQNPTEPQYRALAEESLRKYTVDSGITQPLAVVRVDRVTTQVVSGSLTRLYFIVTGSSDSTTFKCNSKVWEQPWLNKKEITVSCEENSHSSKREVPLAPLGGEVHQNPTEPQYRALAEESLRKYAVDSGITQPLAVARVVKVSTQTVSGTMTRLDFIVTGSSDSTTIECHSEVWEQPWLNKKEITVSCKTGDHRSKREVPLALVGGEGHQNPTEPKYRALAEESLRKYAVDSGITQPLAVVRVDRVTTQVVSGSLTRLDFVVTGSSDTTTIECHSEVWEQPWLNKKEITVSCEENSHRSKREVPLAPLGGEVHQNPTEPQYRALAEESLRKYAVHSGITQPLAVARVVKVSTQTVSGTMTRLDFIVTGSSDSTTIECHSEVWEQPWLNKKEITVSCKTGDHRTKREVPLALVGGEEHQNPTEPKYRALAEESLRKYAVDSGITQPLAVVRVDRVTTQVVSGSLTRLDFVVTGSSDTTTIECHSEVWEQPWLNKKEITVSCKTGDHRSKREVPLAPLGGEEHQNPTEPQYRALAEESLRKYTVDSGITQPLAVVRVDRVTTQVVSGSLTRLYFIVTGSSDSTTFKCNSKVWEQPWLNKKEITVSCEENSHSSKREVPLAPLGGEVHQNPTEPQYRALAEESLRKYAVDSGITQPLAVARVVKVSTQTVSGTMTRLDFIVTGSSDSTTIECHSEVWEQPWLNKKEITVSCETGDHRSKRQIPGGEQQQNPTDPKYRALAEESLRKYAVDSGITQPLAVVRVDRVTTQVVSGSLTRLYFIVTGSSDSTTFKCNSKVWEQPWLNKKEITVSCEENSHRSKREVPLAPLGGEVHQNPIEPQYRALAEESLRKYAVDSGITQPLAVVRVDRVTTQVVSGTMTRLDFIVTGSSDSTTIECHSEVWEQPWLNKKEITVSCKTGDHRSKREVPLALLGGEEHQNPTEPKYRALAEESLRKYVVDSGITQPLAVVRVDRVTTQVVSGSLTRLDFIITGSSDFSTFKCNSKVWEQSWLNKKEITVSCEENSHRSKRSVPLAPLGGEEHQNPTEFKYRALAEESLRKYAVDSGITQPLAVARVEKVSTQTVSGTMTRLDFIVTGSSDSTTIECHSEVWEQPWLNNKEITVSCKTGDHRSKRQIPGGEQQQNPTDPKYRAFAEQSLRKYTIDSGIRQPLELVRIKKVSTQVVAGLLTRIDFVVSVNRSSTTINCHSKILEQGWLNHKEIDVSCHDDRDEGIDSSFIDQDPTKPLYKALAEESLQKYVIDSGIKQPLEVARVERVITQLVSGVLETTGIDFTVSGSYDSNIIKCHSDIRNRPSFRQKDMTVSCFPNNDRVKRDLIMRGGASEESLRTTKYQYLDNEWIRDIDSENHSELPARNLRGQVEEEQEPNKPEYKQLAEEALRKLYRKKSTVYHKVLAVQRVVTRVVSGFKYKIDFTAAPTSCSVNVSSVRARSCKADDDVLLYCHTDIWDRPWLKQKKIDVQCNDPKDDYETDNDVKPSDPQNFNEKYMKLAEEASEKYLTTSNRKYVHKVTEILSAREQVADGTLTNIDFSISPTTCLRNETTNKTSCTLKQPLVVFNCNANIRSRPGLNVENDITVTCKKISEAKGKKSKRQAGEIPSGDVKENVVEDEDEIDEDTIYYYADRAVQHLNDRGSSNNLHKLITIHDVQNSIQMATVTVKMYIEVAETFCLRHRKKKILQDCEELSGANHKLCLARLWPSPEDELVVRHVSVVCDDDEDFASITGVNINELLRISIAVLESPAENKFKLIHHGEPQVLPSLDSRRPFKLNFLISITNCSKDVNLEKDPFQCFLNPNIPPRHCRSYIWLKAEAKYISNIDANCVPAGRNRRSLLDPENVTLDYSEIQSMVGAALEKLEMQSLHRYKQRVLQINSHSTKITSGKVTTIDFDVGYTSCLKYEWVANITSCNFLEHLPRRRCVAQIWERLWINNGKNIDVNCVDDETPLESHIEFESAEMANELAKQALKHIEAKYPHPSKQKVVRIFSLEKQVVAGIHYKMKVEVGFTDCLALSDQKDCKLVTNGGLNKFCRVNVWIRPWTDHPPNFRVACDFQEGATHEFYHRIQAEHLFYNFLTTYSPSYVNNYSQMHKRFEIFKDNIKKIHELNVHEKGTAMYGMTRFSDLTYEEFSTTYMGLNKNLTNENQVPMKQADIPNIKVPDNFDWREYDAVTDVKDQGSCGSCWAFSVTGNIEGQWKMQSGQLVSLSEQELVDCDKLDNGCSGGLPDNAYRFIEQTGGLELEIDYPYEGTDDKCDFNKTLAKVQISSAVNITTNETGMAQWLVHNGPISIGINANAMQFYMGGISHPWKMLCNPTNLDHGVLIVGYGVKDYPLFHKKLPYWIIKNSWGKSWGEQGYYRVYRGDGTCGVNQMASSAVI